MIRHLSIGVIGILLFLIFTSGCIISAQNTTPLEPVPAEQINQMDAALYPLTYLITKDMEQACCLVGKTARELDGVPADDPAVELALLKLRRDIPFSFEAGLFDTNDTLIASTEDLGKTMEIGVGKATNHYTEEELKAAGPACIVSGYSRLLFEDNGVTITSPVYDAEGNYNGTLRIGINTGSLFSGLNEYLRNEYGYTLWVAQPDGLVIYDKDTEEIGKNLLTDSLYQGYTTKNAAKMVVEHPSGNVSYFFYDATWVNLSQRNAVWDTVYPGYGMEWRMVVTDNAEVKDTNETTATPTTEELKSFVEKAYV